MPCETCLAFLIREYKFFGKKPEGLSSAVFAASQ